MSKVQQAENWSASFAGVPPPDHVDVWRTPVTIESDIAALTHGLSQEEQARAARFRFAADRAAFITARAMLRSVLGQYVGDAPDQLAFTAGPHGKPELAAPRGIAFNLSHSAGWSVCAVARVPVGIDIEAREARTGAGDVLRMLAPPERAELEALTGAAQVAALARIWTRKEAVMKATGLGMALPLANFVVSAEDPPRVIRFDGGEAGAWSLRGFAPSPSIVGAVAVLAPLAADGLRRFTWAP